VADFVRRRLGPELLRYAINPLVGGIYAGDPERLSLRHGFPKLHALEQEHGGLIRGALAKMRQARAERRRTGAAFRKRLLSFRAGMGELPELLGAALGGDLRTGVSIASIRKEADGWEVGWKEAFGEARRARFARLVLTVPAYRLRSLPLPNSVLAGLGSVESIEYPPVSVLSLAFRRGDVAHPLDGFGALVPECEGHRILGALFPSSLFAGRAPEGEVLLTVFTGGTRQPGEATADTEALVARVLPELRDLLGVSGEPVYLHHRHWPKAIPQYTLDYGSRLAAISALEARHPGLRLSGNYRHGISVSYCLEAALKNGD
jgi:oxygen-dependent protoporphyrinogen oxidase